MLVFVERGKPEYPEKNLSEQSREPTNSAHIWRRGRESNPGHIGGRRALSPLRQPCSPVKKQTNVVAQLLMKIGEKRVKCRAFNDAIQSFLSIIKCETSLSRITSAELLKLFFNAGVQKVMFRPKHKSHSSVLAIHPTLTDETWPFRSMLLLP